MIYLDNASTTKPYLEVSEIVGSYHGDVFYNPDSPYSSSRVLGKNIDGARADIAHFINAEKSEIVFTSGGSESNSTAILGTVLNCLSQQKKCHIITSAIEHHSVLNACKAATRYGARVTYLEVDSFGFVDEKKLADALCKDTVLVSVMMANNEIGTLQHIDSLCKIVKEYNGDILFHSDAVQAFGNIPIDVRTLNIDILSASAHKFGGPKGAGFLYCKNGVNLDSIIYGGRQERGFRGGTTNVAGVLGMHKAACVSVDNIDDKREHMLELKCALYDRLSVIDGFHVNGVEREPSLYNDTNIFLPNILNVSFDDVDGERLIAMLDHDGVMCSRASACEETSSNLSHVLKAIGISDKRIKESVRISFGYYNTILQIEEAADIIEKRVKVLRNII